MTRQHDMYHCWCGAYHAPLAVPSASRGQESTAQAFAMAGADEECNCWSRDDIDTTSCPHLRGKAGIR